MDRLPAFDYEFDGEKYEAEFATVDQFSLENEDHGAFVVSLNFAGPGWGQGISPHALDSYDKDLKKRIGTAFGCDYIMEVVKRIGSPEKAKGRQVIILRKNAYDLIEGFAAFNNGEIGEPFFPQALADKHFPPVTGPS